MKYFIVFFPIRTNSKSKAKNEESYAKMYQQYVYQAQSAIAYLSTDELKELINDDEKLEERVMDVVSVPFYYYYVFTHIVLPCFEFGDIGPLETIWRPFGECNEYMLLFAMSMAIQCVHLL